MAKALSFGQLRGISFRRLRTLDRAPGQPAIPANARHTKDDKDAVDPDNRDAQIRRPFDPHETDVVVGCGKGYSIQPDKRHSGEDREHAPRSLGDGGVNDVEADFL